MESRFRNRAFTLVEIMIVVMIIGLLLTIAAPQFIRARDLTQHRTCVVNLRKIDDAKQIMAQEKFLHDGDAVLMSDIWPEYIKCPGQPQCPGGGTYTIGTVGAEPTCSYQIGPFPHLL